MGKKVPEPIVEFDELLGRYSVPSRLLKNLSEYGYSTPTGIQSQGIPILLEVRQLVLNHRSLLCHSQFVYSLSVVI